MPLTNRKLITGDLINAVKLPIDSQFVILMAAADEAKAVEICGQDIYIQIRGKTLVLDHSTNWWDLHELGEQFGIPGESFVAAGLYCTTRHTPLMPYRILFEMARKGWIRENIHGAFADVTRISEHSLSNFFEWGTNIHFKHIIELLDMSGLTLPDIILSKDRDMSMAALAEKISPLSDIFHRLTMQDMKILVGVAKILNSKQSTQVLSEAARELIIRYRSGESIVRKNRFCKLDAMRDNYELYQKLKELRTQKHHEQQAEKLRSANATPGSAGGED